MTGLMLHGIVAAEAPAPNEAPDHERVVCGDLAGLVSPLPAGLTTPTDPDATARAALEHNALLLAMTLTCGVVPVRFGTVFADRAGVAAALASQAKRSQALLRQLGRSGEFSLRATAHPAATIRAAPAPDGRSFLRRKSLERQTTAHRRAERARALEDAVCRIRHWAQAWQAGAAQEGRLLDLTLLVSPEVQPELRTAVAEEAATLAALNVGLGLTGPWPPYSFCLAEEAA